jgi:hypothetical protein
MFLCVYIYVCLFVPVCIRCASRIDCDPVPSFEESTIKLRRPNDPVLRVLRDRRPWASVWWRQVSSDLLCPIYFIIHQPTYHDQPKKLTSFVFTLSLITFWVIMVSFMILLYSNQWTWCEHLWYSVVSMIMLLDWWYFRGLERFLECLFVRTCSLDDRPGKQCNHEGRMGRP